MVVPTNAIQYNVDDTLDQTTNMNDIRNRSLSDGNGPNNSDANDVSPDQMDISVNNLSKTEGKRSLDESDEPSGKRIRTKNRLKFAFVTLNLTILSIHLHCVISTIFHFSNKDIDMNIC